MTRNQETTLLCSVLILLATYLAVRPPLVTKEPRNTGYKYNIILN